MKKPDCRKYVVYDVVKKPGLWERMLHKKRNKVDTLRGLHAGKGEIHQWIAYNQFKENRTKVPTDAKKRRLSMQLVSEFYCGDKIPLARHPKKLTKYKDDKYYYVHHNGGRPFMVCINKKYVDVLRIPRNMHIPNDARLNKNHYSELVVSLKKPKHVFIGKSPKNAMTEFSGGYGKYCDGNTILVKTGKDEYVFIGWKIFSFRTPSEIVSYLSPVGNNDVPYPFAVDKDGNQYLFLESVVLSDVPKGMDPYDHYYDKSPSKRKHKKFRKKVICHQVL